jgi:hypothetical protein
LLSHTGYSSCVRVSWWSDWFGCVSFVDSVPVLVGTCVSTTRILSTIDLHLERDLSRLATSPCDVTLIHGGCILRPVDEKNFACLSVMM